MRRMLTVVIVALLLVATVLPVAAQDGSTPDTPGQAGNLFLPLVQSGDAVSVSAAKSGGVRSSDRTAPGAARFKGSKNVYIVSMIGAPVVAYTGGIPGYEATKPPKGQKIDPNSAKVVRYASYLDAQHDAAINRAGGGRKLYSYRYSFNGFAAELGNAQLAALATDPSVAFISKDELRTLDTSSTPSFLGLSGEGGVWATTGAVGENVIIGIIDGGIWPEHPSFSDRTGLNGNGTQGGKLNYQQIPGWHGKCVPGEAFVASNCNQKLIGAQYFNQGWGGNAGIDAQLPWEYNSPRDFGGHGTHTASTAGGNKGVPATGAAAAFGFISGIAPRARIAAYKVCWETGAEGSCFSTDSVAAIDQAVADGVDVINFSISGSSTNFRDPVEIAFLYAADAGVFVAASAGNSGPTTSTVAHPGPWLTTVAAGTHNRDGVGSVKLGNGVTYSGASVATEVTAPLIDSTAAGLAGADATALALCFAAADNGGTPVLDPAKVKGKIVVCDRGINARVNKSMAVKEAGGVGMILVNTSINSINADFHFLPTVHLQNTERAAVKAYAATPGATATINKAQIVLNAAAPFTASFSSRGPLRAGNGDLLKPDLIAPGQDILAAVAPPGNSGREFDLYSGTSMSSPHVAGLAALLKGLHPTWSPMMIKSALMTTGYDVLDGPNTDPLVIFRQGAGHVRPNAGEQPGLGLRFGLGDWLGFLCGTQLPHSFCTSGGIPVLDPSNFNSPSIAIGDLAGTQTVTRTVTNVGSAAATYTASSSASGFSVSINPASLTLNPGESKSYAVTFTRTTASLNSYTGGQLTWSDGTHTVRSPIVVRPVALAAPTRFQARWRYFVQRDLWLQRSVFCSAPGLVPAAVTPGHCGRRSDRRSLCSDLAQRAVDSGGSSSRHDVCTFLPV